MAKGLPDYNRGVDIKYQELNQVTTRPKYGGGIMKPGIVEVTASDYTLLRLVNGKGMLYGGALWLDYKFTQANSQVWLKTDNYVLNDLSFIRLSEYGIDNPRSAPVTLNVFDSENHIYSVGFSYGITFETSLELGYFEKYGKTPTVHYRLMYALISDAL